MAICKIDVEVDDSWLLKTQVLTLAEIKVFVASKPSALLQKSKLIKTEATFFPKVTSDNCPPILKRKSVLIRSTQLQHSPGQTPGYLVRDLPRPPALLCPQIMQSLQNVWLLCSALCLLTSLHLKVISTLNIFFRSRNLDLRIN